MTDLATDTVVLDRASGDREQESPAVRAEDRGFDSAAATATMETGAADPVGVSIPEARPRLHKRLPNEEEDATADGFDRELSGRQAVLPRLLPHRRVQTFVTAQAWEGTVVDVRDDAFLARLTDEEGDEPEQEAEFPLEEVDPADRELVVPGSVFYWRVGYLDSENGRTRASHLMFRRLPRWTARELEAARRKAQRTRELLGW